MSTTWNRTSTSLRFHLLGYHAQEISPPFHCLTARPLAVRPFLVCQFGTLGFQVKRLKITRSFINTFHGVTKPVLFHWVVQNRAKEDVLPFIPSPHDLLFGDSSSSSDLRSRHLCISGHQRGGSCIVHVPFYAELIKMTKEHLCRLLRKTSSVFLGVTGQSIIQQNKVWTHCAVTQVVSHSTTVIW